MKLFFCGMWLTLFLRQLFRGLENEGQKISFDPRLCIQNVKEEYKMRPKVLRKF